MHTRIIDLFMVVLALQLVSFGSSCFADDPKRNETTLFHLDRNRDTDRVIYALNQTENGLVDQDRPIEVYWLKNSDMGNREPLTRIQQKYGYGVKVIKQDEHAVYFHLAALPDQVFVARANLTGVKGFIRKGTKEIEIRRLFVHFKGSSYWNPVVDRIDLYGLDKNRDEIQLEKYYPKK